MKGPVLVTGASGLIGLELVPALRREGYEVVTASRRGAGVDHHGDLAAPGEADVVVAATRPAALVHLAGGPAAEPDALWRNNVLATHHVLAAASRLRELPTCIIVGSAAEYGGGALERLSEERPARPVTDYGRAKAAQVLLARRLAAARDLPLTVLRPFNVVSRRLPETTALGNMRRQLLAGSGTRRRVECGRLDVVRDYVPAGAVVEAIRRVLERPQPGATINVCSGIGLELGRILDALARRLGVTAVPVVSPELEAMAAADRVVGDPTRLRALLGLVVEVSAESLAAELLAEPPTPAAGGSDLAGR